MKTEILADFQICINVPIVIALNKYKNASREVLSFKNVIYEEKCGRCTQNERVLKKFPKIKFVKKIRTLNLGLTTLQWFC